LPSLKLKCQRNIDFNNSEEIKAYNKLIFPDLKYIIHDTIRPILYLMLTVAYGQGERIEVNLIHFKAIKIMMRIADNFSETDNRNAAFQIIKIQIQYMRDKNMKVISKIYDNIELEDIEDWIKQSDDLDTDKDELTNKEVNELSKEFHIKYYWHHLEKLQEEYEEAEGEDDNEVLRRKPLAKRMKITNEYYKLFRNLDQNKADYE